MHRFVRDPAQALTDQALPIARCRSSNPARSEMVVMPGLVPGIHVFLLSLQQDVDGRVQTSVRSLRKADY
jgi:hypothetical protein